MRIRGIWSNTRSNTWRVLIVLGALCLAVGFFATAFGGTAGSMTLDEFRKIPEAMRTAMVAGAMATTEHAGLRCPEPQTTVAEYVSALQWRILDASKPWITYYFMLVDQRGCRQIEEERNPDGNPDGNLNKGA